MCCFSREVRSVSATRIFARHLFETRQALIYSMTIDAPTEVAMILPIPVAAGAKENAVNFANLHAYTGIFDDMEACFPVPKSKFDAQPGGAPALGGTLSVVDVGSFRASFVPTVKDFARLDSQFRLPDDVWSKIGQYDHFGFAVFQLKKGAATIHPMAFDFPTAMPDRLFFPTVHIHDGKVHPKAHFDHMLYCQPARLSGGAIHDWQESPSLATSHVKVKLTKGLVSGGQHVYRRRMAGELPNSDVLLAVV